MRLLAIVLSLLVSAPAGAEVVLIHNATVHVRPGQKIEDAGVLLRDGKIAQVGTNLKPPAGARVIDAKGGVVTAGLIDAYSEAGLVEVDLVRETNEGSFGGGDDVVHAAYRVTDGYNPHSVYIPVLRSGGVTSAVSVPRGAFVAGQSALLTLKEGATTQQRILRSPVAMHATLGRGAIAYAGGARGLAVEKLRELLDDAVQYSRRKAAYERRQTRDFTASRLDLEALVPVVRGQVPLLVRADRASDIRAALRLARDLRLRLLIAGGAEAWMVAGELAAQKVPVLMDVVENIPSSFDEIHIREDAVVILRKAGVPILLSPMGSNSPWRLRQTAGQAVAFGLSWDDALASITTAPAETFGLRDRGVLRPGAVADVVVWSGDPLEVTTHATHVFIEGEEQPLRTRQTLLFERFRTLPAF